MVKPLPQLIIILILAASCGKKSGGAPVKDDAAAPVQPQVAPIAMPALGVDRIARFNFIYDQGAPAYDKAVAKKKARDWSAVRAECELALAKDPAHLDAHWLLGTALVQVGEAAAAVDHFALALAGDYYKYGPALGADAELVDFLATPHGKSVAALALQIRGEYARRIANAAWVVGRRSTFKWPRDYGVQPNTTRGELYAFDREQKRYLRLTHTDHQVAGFVRAPSGGEAAIVGFDKIDRPKSDDAPPLFARAWVAALDSKDWKPLGPRAQVAAARRIVVGYGAGEELVVGTAPATGRWTVGDTTWSSLDRKTGKLAKIGEAKLAPQLELTLDEGRLVRAPGVDITRAGDGVVSSIKTRAGVAIAIPESGQVAEATIATAPDGARVAFATAVDPCAKDAAPSLYVADARTGTFKHLLTGRSRFATRWIDPTTLAYEDSDGAIRLWDALTGREAQRLDNRPGLALDVLSLASGPLCKQAPPTIEPAGADEAMPKEEPAGAGPVTSPPP